MENLGVEVTSLGDGPFRLGLATVSQLALHADFSPELAAAIRRNGAPKRAIRALKEVFLPQGESVRNDLPLGSIILPRPVRVDRSKPLADMIRETGCDNWDWATENITEEDFHVDRSGFIQGRLVYEKELILLAPYEEGITTKQWWDWMDDHELRREEVPELAAFGRYYPEVWLRHYTIGFGSSCLRSDGRLGSPVLWGAEGRRKFSRGWFRVGDQWDGRFRALVSRRRLR